MKTLGKYLKNTKQDKIFLIIPKLLCFFLYILSISFNDFINTSYKMFIKTTNKNLKNTLLETWKSQKVEKKNPNQIIPILK